jgi:hypothetical protein
MCNCEYLTRANLARKLVPEMGIEAAAEFADLFCKAIMPRSMSARCLRTAPMTVT